MIIGKIAPPKPVPAYKIPVANPLLLANHSKVSDAIGIHIIVAPQGYMIPEVTIRCHGPVAKPDSKMPRTASNRPEYWTYTRYSR